MKLGELLQRRGKLVDEMRAIREKADSESRLELNAEEKQTMERLESEFNSIDERYEAELELRKKEARVNERGEAQVGGKEQPQDTVSGKPKDEENRAIFRKFLRGGLQALSGVETRALAAGTDQAGGFIVTPETFVAELIKDIDDMVFIRQLATKYEIGRAEALGVPSIETDVSDADWTSEVAIGDEDTSLAFGHRELDPHPLGKLIKVSNKLIRCAAINPEQIVRERLVYKFGVTQEKGFLTGHGAQQPLGVFTASDNGISTSRDVSAGNTTTSMTCDGLLAAKYALKAGYWKNGRWCFHRDGVLQVAQLKDGEGQYIWRESVRVGEPDRLLSFPVMMSEYAPNTFESGLYVGVLGDFSNYAIADALDMQIQRLTELFAATNQVGFIGRAEVDGMPVQQAAFVRVKLA
jgi:HK97 family phage major capsid protein